MQNNGNNKRNEDCGIRQILGVHSAYNAFYGASKFIRRVSFVLNTVGFGDFDAFAAHFVEPVSHDIREKTLTTGIQV